MCGIFGIIAYSDSKVSTKKLESSVLRAFSESERRGKDSSGALSVTSRYMFITKSPKRGRDLIRTVEFRKLLQESISSYLQGETFAFFGHTRMATHGSVEIDDNNQPVIAHGSVVLHNGIIVNYEEIYSENPVLNRMFEVDSEVLLSLVSSLQDSQGDEFDSVNKACQMCRGANTFMYLNSTSNNVYLNSSNGSLYVFEDKLRGLFVFASEYQTLDKIITELGHEFLSDQEKTQSKNITTTLSLERPREFDLDGFDNKFESIGNLERQIINLKPEVKKSDRDLIPEIKTDVFKLPKLFYESLPNSNDLARCITCVLPSNYPYLKFDKHGMCDFCSNQRVFPQLGIEQLISDLKIDSNSKYLVPISGGRDSCYALHVLAKDLNLNLVAFTYDWGFVTDVARRNISRMCGELGVEHILVAADLNKKRKNVQLNVAAWLKRPHLGMIPLFMAGDKDFFKFATQIKNQMKLSDTVFGMTRFEPAGFKTGFAGVNESKQHEKTFDLEISNKVKLASFYAKQAIQNPSYFNSSIFDSLSGYYSYYFRKKDYLQIFDYISWNELEVVSKLRDQYGWENSTAVKNTWRIGDASAPFYNYVYSYFSGFTENDVYLSNLVRDGQILREDAIKLVVEYNSPDEEGFIKYCALIGLSPLYVLERILQTKGYAQNVGSW